LRRGVRDMVRISDARMSGTSYGTCVLHVSPTASAESAPDLHEGAAPAEFRDRLCRDNLISETSNIAMKKLKIPANLTVLAYESIKQYILDGRLDGDARLTEEYLATQLGISKSPIREALNRLEAEGLIRIEPRRGAYLRAFSIQDISDLYDLREALEKHVAHSAKMTPEFVLELKQSIRKMRQYLRENDKSRYIEEDMRFHAALANATGNDRLAKVLENVQNQIWIFRRKTYDLSSSSAPDFHEGIVRALEKNDRAKAERAMSDHIRNVRRKLLEFLEAQQSAEPVAS
jgi:DNA-binding GntR family transcriptional regulator